jgi:hypothetical protein
VLPAVLADGGTAAAPYLAPGRLITMLTLTLLLRHLRDLEICRLADERTARSAIRRKTLRLASQGTRTTLNHFE